MVKAILFLMAAMAAGSALAQPLGTEDRAKRSDEILQKMRKMELANQILPLVMTKEQLRELLPAIEKGRKAVKDAQTEEYDTMRKFESRLDQAIKDATEKGQIPGKAMLVEMNNLLTAFSIKRRAIASDNVTAVVAVIDKTFNAGQRKVAMNSLDMKLYDPTIKEEELTDTVKLRFFVGEILLDPLAYELLVKLSM